MLWLPRPNLSLALIRTLKTESVKRVEEMIISKLFSADDARQG